MPEFIYTTREGTLRRALYSEEDQDLITQFTWRIDRDGFMRRNSPRDSSKKQTTIFFHKIVGERLGFSHALTILRLNGNPGDNRRENLRSVTKQQAHRYRGKHYNNQSGFKGVVKQRRKFRAQTTLNNKSIIIGYFDSAEEAHQAYCDYVRPLHGEFFHPQ